MESLHPCFSALVSFLDGTVQADKQQAKRKNKSLFIFILSVFITIARLRIQRAIALIYYLNYLALPVTKSRYDRCVLSTHLPYLMH